MALQRMQSSTRSFAPEGQLPGLDVKRHNYDALYGSLQQEVNITCIDYRCGGAATGNTNDFMGHMGGAHQERSPPYDYHPTC